MKWLKEIIKQDVLAFLVLAFLLGTAVIWFSPDFTDLRLSADGKLNATVSWLTALAIFWYAFETYQLKKSSADQTAMQEIIMQNEFLPILEPLAGTGGAKLISGRLSGFAVRNLGRGPAKYIQLHVGNLHASLEWSLAEGETKAVPMPAELRREVAALLRSAPISISLRLTYQDIYKRKFQTQHIVFDRQSRGDYRLRSGAWDFKRVRKSRGLY